MAARRAIGVLGLLTLGPIAMPAHAQNADQQSQRTIILPLELIAGQPATFTVLAADGHIAPGTKAVLSNGEIVTTDESGRAHFLVQSDIGVMFARIPGTEVCEAADILPQTSNDNRLQVTQIPKTVSLENHFAVSGRGFHGDADRNRITMDGKRVYVLASSPVQLIVMPAVNVPPGPTSLTITEGLEETATNVALVSFTSLNSSEPQIRRGRKTQLVLVARGTQEPLDLRIQNLDPQTVRLAHGTEAYLRTTGGLDNSVVLQLKGKGTGPFSFAISLESATAEADAPVARDFLIAAEKAAEPLISRRIEKILKELRGKSVGISKIRNDIQQLQMQSGSGDFQALIRASLRALNDE